MNQFFTLLLSIFFALYAFNTNAADTKENAPQAQQAVSKFENALLKAQTTKDYIPAFNDFLKTSFFVLVNADKNAKQGDKIKDFSFVIASKPQTPEKPVVVISQDIQRLGGIQEGNITAIKISGSELILALHPKVSIAIALQSGIFEMDSKLVQELKNSLLSDTSKTTQPTSKK